MKLATLKRRREFLRLRGGLRVSSKSFLVEAKPRLTATKTTGDPQSGPRVGFTVTRKLGNAVVRNRIRRRLKHAFADALRVTGLGNIDFVVVARPPALTTKYAELCQEAQSALARIERRHGEPKGRKRN